MKKIWMILVMAGMYQVTALAQDLVVTSDGDSLNCKITQIKGDYVYFTFKYQNEIRNTLLPVTKVKFYQYNYYAVPDVLPFQIVGYQPEFPHWRLAFNVGWSYRTPRIADGLDPVVREHIRKLKTGFAITLDASYFFTEMFGAGFKYDMFKSSNSTPILDGNINLNFIGPAFAMRFYNHTKTNCWFMDYGIGYMGYRENMSVPGTTISMKGNTAGFVMDIGYDFALSKNWSAGIQLSLLSGMLSEMDITTNGVTEKVTLEKGQFEGLHRLNISVGLRCNL